MSDPRSRNEWISDAEDMLSDFDAVDAELKGQMTSWRRSSVLHLYGLGIEPSWIAENYSLNLGEVIAVIESNGFRD